VAQTSADGETSRQRALAVEALGKIWGLQKSKSNDSPNRSALTTDPSPAVRTQAAVVLSRMRAEDKEMLAPIFLRDSIGEGNRVCAKEIILAMVKFPDVCVEGLEQLTAR